MLHIRYRFHGRAGIRYVYRHGGTVRGRSLTCRYLKNERRRMSRVSVVISKKVLKSAVGRNRIRRRLYEAIRHRLPDLASPYDIVLIVTSSELRSCSHEQLEQTLTDTLTEAGLNKVSHN